MTNPNKHPQRKKRFKPPKNKEKKPRKPRVLKKAVKCGHRHKSVCEKHGDPCAIAVDFPPDDERHNWKAKLVEMGAPVHGKESEHRCKKCMAERFEHSPHQNLEVEGLNHLQSSRIKGEQGGFILKPES